MRNARENFSTYQSQPPDSSRGGFFFFPFSFIRSLPQLFCSPSPHQAGGFWLVTVWHLSPPTFSPAPTARCVNILIRDPIFSQHKLKRSLHEISSFCSFFSCLLFRSRTDNDASSPQAENIMQTVLCTSAASFSTPNCKRTDGATNMRVGQPQSAIQMLGQTPQSLSSLNK